MPEQLCTLLINPLASPLQFALYDSRGELEDSWEREGYVSESLTDELDRLLKERSLGEIVYVNGPGSYMGIKLCYITLRTLELVRGIPFRACSAFSLNEGRPIKAMGSLYFVKEKETIITRKFKEKIPQVFSPPSDLAALEPAQDRRPDYRIPAV
ncbi:hypothetical protein [Nitratifractor sp.]